MIDYAERDVPHVKIRIRQTCLRKRSMEDSLGAKSDSIASMSEGVWGRCDSLLCAATLGGGWGRMKRRGRR
jgi:hypothetical protein